MTVYRDNKQIREAGLSFYNKNILALVLGHCIDEKLN